jgi:hypothetical protein
MIDILWLGLHHIFRGGRCSSLSPQVCPKKARCTLDGPWTLRRGIKRNDYSLTCASDFKHHSTGGSKRFQPHRSRASMTFFRMSCISWLVTIERRDPGFPKSTIPCQRGSLKWYIIFEVLFNQKRTIHCIYLVRSGWKKFAVCAWDRRSCCCLSLFSQTGGSRSNSHGTPSIMVSWSLSSSSKLASWWLVEAVMCIICKQLDMKKRIWKLFCGSDYHRMLLEMQKSDLLVVLSKCVL